MSVKRKSGTAGSDDCFSPHVSTWPSHTPFKDMIDYSVRGSTNPVLKTMDAGDEVSRTCMLVLDDTDRVLWNQKTNPEGVAARQLLSRLMDRVRSGDVGAAETVFAIATEAAHNVDDIYERQRDLFDRIAPRKVTLACLHTVHPETPAFLARMIADARLGSQTRLSRQVHSKAYFVSDAPANIYARAIITSIELNQCLEPIESQQENWSEFERQEGVKVVVQPFPKYVEGIDQIPVPIGPESVLQYWQKGKEIILEEVPDFHMRPEWENYRQRRTYRNGAKKGAVQNAIFRDILAALKTIAGGNRRGCR